MAKERIGPYHLERRIGEGGQSVVWAATDVRSGRQVALKVLRPGLASPSDVARLRREGATLAALQDPGLPRGFELYEDPSAGTIALAMELIEGHTLADAGRLEPAAVLVLARELVRVVAVLHQRGIVHRDIKPGNILLRPGWVDAPTGRVVLVDLGIARGLDANNTTHTAAGGAVGTLAFLAPEALLGGERPTLQTALDVYSLGVLLWLLLAGTHPTGLTLTSPLVQLIAAHTNPRPAVIADDRRELVERAVPGFLGIVAHCLEPDPARRPRDATVLASGFQNLSAAGAPAASPTAGPPGAAPWTQYGGAGPTNMTGIPPGPDWTGYQHGTAPTYAASPPVAYDASRQAPTVVVKPRAGGAAWIVGILVAVVAGGGLLLVLGIILVVSAANRQNVSSSPAAQATTTPAVPNPTPGSPPTPVTVVPTPGRPPKIGTRTGPAEPAGAPFPSKTIDAHGKTTGVVHSAPNVKSTEVTRVPNHDWVYILSPSEIGLGMCQVRTRDGKDGYMHWDLLGGRCAP